MCRRLDGLPLAVELAAARLNILDPKQLEERLGQGLDVVAGENRGALPRHQTLIATLDWSYELLSDEEKTVLNRLSVFTGSFTLEAAEQVCSGNGVGQASMLDILSSLVDKSLVIPHQGKGGRRFRILETIREYTTHRLADASEQTLYRRRHATYFQRLAVEAGERLWGPEEAKWLDRLDNDWPNLRRAFRWHLEEGRIQEGQLMVGARRIFYARRHHVTEGLEWVRRLVEADTTPSRARALALHVLALYEDSSLWDEVIELSREFGSELDLWAILYNAALSAINAGDYETARERSEEQMRIDRDLGNPLLLSFSLNNLALLAVADGDPHRAVVLQEEALQCATESGSAEAIPYSARDLGEFRRYAGDLEGASAALLEAQKLRNELGVDQNYAGYAEILLAAVALDRGDTEDAVSHLLDYDEAVRFLKEDRDDWAAAEKPLLEWARIALAVGKNEVAATLLGARDRFQLDSPLIRRPLPLQKAQIEEARNMARQRLDDDRFNKAWNRGQQMTADQTLEYALQTLTDPHS